MESFRGKSPHKTLQNADEIRVVKLFPNTIDGHVRCELEHVRLSENPFYVCLSYVWGNPEDKKPITLNGEPYAITSNLESFLRHMQALLRGVIGTFAPEMYGNGTDLPTLFWLLARLPMTPDGVARLDTSDTSPCDLRRRLEASGRFTSAMPSKFGGFESPNLNSVCLRFWIDAICINQEDILERNQQVQLMAQIYQNAHDVYAWLGSANGNPPAAEVFSVFQEIDQRVETEGIGFSRAVDLVFEERPDESRWDPVWALRWVVQDDYFKRVWTIQEFAMSASEPRLWVGFSSVITAFFLDWASQVYGAYMDREGTSQQIHWQTPSRRMEKTRGLYQRFLSQQGNNGELIITEEATAGRLLDLLQDMAPGSEMTDPRDIIYSLLGMLATRVLPPAIQPNYASPVDKVFHSAASFLLASLGPRALDPLLSAERGIVSPGVVPSWVPDFRTIPSKNSSQEDVNIDDQKIEISQDNQRLGLGAVFIDTIAKVIDLTSSFTLDDMRLDYTIQQIAPIVRQDLVKLETLVIDNLSRISGHDAADSIQEWQKFLAEIIRPLSLPAWNYLVGRGYEEQDSQSLSAVESTKVGDTFLLQLLFLIGHVPGPIALTSGGHVVAVGPNIGRGPLREGDRVCLIKGVTKKCALRQTGDGYQVAGVVHISTIKVGSAEEFYASNKIVRITLV